MTLFEIASAVDSAVTQNIGNSSSRVPMNLIEDEIANQRNQIIGDLARKGALTLDGLYQIVPCIDMATTDGCCLSVLSLPKLMYDFNIKPVNYIGGTCFTKPFKVLMLNDGVYNEFSPSARMNAVEIRADYKLKLHNTKLNKLAGRFILDNPKDIAQYDCCLFNEDTPYPVPGSIRDAIISRLTDKYVKYFYRYNKLPNTQEDNLPTKIQ